MEEVPEAGDEPDGAAGGGEAPAGREREAAEGELGAQQRLSIWLPHALQRFLISLPSVCFLCFLFSALRITILVTNRKKDHHFVYVEVIHMFGL